MIYDYYVEETNKQYKPKNKREKEKFLFLFSHKSYVINWLSDSSQSIDQTHYDGTVYAKKKAIKLVLVTEPNKQKSI